VRAVRGASICLLGITLGAALGCERTKVQALPNPDAEPPVVIIGPSGKRPDASRKLDAARLEDAAEALGDAGLEAALEDAAPEVEAAPTFDDAAVAAPVVLGPTRGPLIIGTANALDVLSRKAAAIGRIPVPGEAIRAVSHDRRDGDGVWTLVASSPARIAKIGWDGSTIRTLTLTRPPLARARAFLGLDHVMGHSAASDLLLVLYVNMLGVPVVEGIRIRDGTMRFSIGFSKEANVTGVRADGLRHDTVDGLLVLDWWTVRDGERFERWRFFYGFVDRLEDRRLGAHLDAFDVPPWREIWGVDRAKHRVVRLGSDGALVEVMPIGEQDPQSLAISP